MKPTVDDGLRGLWYDNQAAPGSANASRTWQLFHMPPTIASEIAPSQAVID